MIYSNEPPFEPPHVHVYDDGREVKIWLEDPPRIERARGMAPHDQSDALDVVRTNLAALRKAWHDRH